MTWYQITTAIISGLGFLSGGSFIVRWVSRSGGKWMESEHGWFLMTMAVGLTSLFGLILANQLFPGWGWRRGVSIAVFSLILCLTFWLPRILSVSIRLDEEESKRKKEQQI